MFREHGRRVCPGCLHPIGQMASQIGHRWKLSFLIPSNHIVFDQDPSLAMHHPAAPTPQGAPVGPTSIEAASTPPDGITPSATASQRWIPAGYENDPYWLRTTQQANCVDSTTFCATMATTILCLLSSATCPPHQNRFVHVQQHLPNICLTSGSFQ